MVKYKINRRRLFIKEMQTLAGVFLWKFYFFLYKGDKVGKLFLVVPQNSDRELYYLLLYFNKILKKRQLVVLITEDMRVYDWTIEIAEKYFFRKKVTKLEMKSLLLAFPYMRFRDQLMIVSVNQPIGRQGTNMLGKDGITFNELFSVGVLKLKEEYYNELLRPNKVTYHGTNVRLKDFIIKWESEINESAR